MKRLAIVVLGLVLSIVLMAGVLPACKAGPTTTAQPSPTTTAEPVRIGFIGILSGPAIMWGITALHGVELWAEKVNAAGGINVGGQKRQLEVVAEDEKATPSEAEMAARKLITSDKVSVISGPSWMSSVLAIGPLSTRYKTMVMPMSGGGIRPEFPYVWEKREDCYEWAPAAMWYLAKTYPQIKRVAYVCQDDMSGRVALEACSTLGAKIQGQQLVYTNLFPVDTTDFYPIATAIKKANVDHVIFGPMYPAFSASLQGALYELGWHGLPDCSPFSVSSFDIPLTLSKVPKEYIERYLSWLVLSWDDPYFPQWCRDFYNEYNKRHPGEWNVCSGINVEGLVLWKEAVEACGTLDVDPIVNWWKSHEVMTGIYGPAKWGGAERYGTNQMLMADLPMTEIHDGKPVINGVVKWSEWMERWGNLIPPYVPGK